jgi:CRISPR-associated protein Csb3
MSPAGEASISVRVDPTNPGQFFACCGLLELADRLWGGAEGWFDQAASNFLIRSTATSVITEPTDLLKSISRMQLKNEMTESQLQRRKELTRTKKQSVDPRERENLDEEKKKLDALWREASVLLPAPFNLRLDWFLDSRTGGTAFKTWGGQQSVADISFSLHAVLKKPFWDSVSPSEWLCKRVNADCLPFNFDCDLAGVGSDIDLGFSLDPLRATKASAIPVLIRPLLEFLAFVGLQRFRPLELGANLPRSERQYRFSVWLEPAPPQLAGFLASSVDSSACSRTFQFGILYRTDYLKSFLPATVAYGVGK